LMLVQIAQSQLFVALASSSVVFCLCAYVLLTSSSARLRRRGGFAQNDKRYFSLGRFGLPVSIAATAWGVFAIVDIAWPRTAIWNPVAPFHWYFTWAGIIFPVVLLGASFCIYWFKKRGRIGILPEHAAAATPAPEPLEPSRVVV